MDKPSSVDLALEEFQAKLPELKEYEALDLSESDTRSKVIDSILNILGWKEQSIRREQFEGTEGKYLDYTLSTTFPIIIIEAKKAFIQFNIPPGGQRHYRISGAIKSSTDLLTAINQARGYAINYGVTFCCVTNGTQFCFFRATNNLGIPWERQFVTVFRNHQDIASRFLEFYECLSFEAVSAGRFAKAIPVCELPAHETSRFKSLENPHSHQDVRDRNVLYPFTRELIKQVFQSLDNEEASPDLLTHCYVESTRDSSYERGIGELLREHRTHIHEPITRIVTQKRNAGTFQNHFEKLAGSRVSFGSVTLILGTVGAGKTTFLNRFRKVFAKELIEASFVWVSISFNSFVEAHDVLKDWVSDQIGNALLENYGHLDPFSWESLEKVYESDIRMLKNGILKPLFSHDRNAYDIRVAEFIEDLSKKKENHNLKCLEYFAKKSNRQIIIVFDNADQHSPRLQNDVFLLAQKYAQILKCISFISLREESYWKNKEFGGLSAFHPTSFHISAPRIEQVLARRFKYASKLILEDESLVAGHFAAMSLDLTPANIDAIFRALHQTLLGPDKSFIRFIEYMAPGEVRRSLDFVARFLTSGHTNINRMIDARTSTIRPIGFHEFLQAVMLGDRMQFTEAFSDVVNLFSADGKSDQSHFNKVAIIARVVHASGESTEVGKGFVSVTQVCRDCEAIGMTNETTLALIGLLTEKRILATSTFIRDAVDPSGWIRATSAAFYYINELTTRFTYLDIIIADTEIGEPNALAALNAITRQISLEQDRFERLLKRIERCRIFLRYLTKEFSVSSLAKADPMFDVSTANLIKRIQDGYENHVEEIIANARTAFRK